MPGRGGYLIVSKAHERRVQKHGPCAVRLEEQESRAGVAGMTASCPATDWPQMCRGREGGLGAIAREP